MDSLGQRVKSRGRALGPSLPAPAPTSLSKSSTSTSGLFSTTNTDTIMSHMQEDTWKGHRPDCCTKDTAARWQAIHSLWQPVRSRVGRRTYPQHSCPAVCLHAAKQFWWVEARWWNHRDPRRVFCLDTSNCFRFTEEDAVGHLYRSHIYSLYPGNDVIWRTDVFG